MPKDYYKILGVSKDATEEEIKKAYKNLAKQHHPDINKHKDSEEKFKEVNEAFRVLGNSENRQKYDQFGSSEYNQGEGFDNFSGFGAYDFSDLFDSFFDGFGPFSQKRGTRGRKNSRGSDLLYEVEISLQDSLKGIKKTITIPKNETCSKCKGKGVQSESDIKTCDECNGQGMTRQTRRTPFGIFATTGPCQKCGGEGKIIKNPCSTCHGEGRVNTNKKIDIEIPKGIIEGERLRIVGEGEAGIRGTENGDLYIQIRFENDKIFTRDGHDLYLEFTISYPQAVLGAEINVPTLDGTAILTIPSGTEGGTLFKMNDKGLPYLNSSRAGNQYVKVVIDIPKNLNKKQKELLESYSKELGEEIPKNKGFFKKFMGK